ncbi:hypothetical protein DSO57_1018027 [Entomophthora muscae]|uniref:Uncharacterized protein n=1 Tax=Entomophthora muscae TaxID=34485 RepID=A0ACC2UDQ7_9FUNG|nr:hypothetical protein DSO57_1018027 [Entomophthora muscae]
MHLLLIVYFLSAYQAWLKDERSYLDSTPFQTVRSAPALVSLPFSTKLNLSQELELGKDMLWSDTRNARKRSGFDLAKHFPIPPKTYSWSTGKEESMVFYTLNLSVHLEIAPLNVNQGFLSCTTDRKCEFSVFGSIIENWKISSSSKKEDKEWKAILSKVIPHSYFSKKISPPFFIEQRAGKWIQSFRPIRILVSGTFYESNLTDGPLFSPFVAYFPLSMGSELIGISGMDDFCQRQEPPKEARAAPALHKMQAKFCDKNDMSIFYHNY